MKWFAKGLLGLILVITGATALAFLINYSPIKDAVKKVPNRLISKSSKEKNYKKTLLKLHEQSIAIKKFAAAKNYNARYCFMIDMSIPSGTKRFFVYNLQADSVELSGLVAHGQGSAGSNQIEFSNEPGSYCTSLGKYKIGSSYLGKFGLAYKLHGLDATNNKALERFVVLHAHECVPDSEVDPLGICQSQGCPTVNPEFLQKLEKYIDHSEQPVLLNIYR